MERFAKQRVLQTIAELTGDILAHRYCALSGGSQYLAELLERRLAGPFALDELDQRHQVGRVPEVGRRRPSWIGHIFRDAGDRQPGGIAGEDGPARRQPVELTEQVLFEIQLFADRFEHERSLTDRRGQIGRAMDPSPRRLR